MADTVTKEEWELIQQHRKAKEAKPTEAEAEPEEVETIEVEEAAFEEVEVKKYEKCECGYDKLEKGMKYCPSCAGELDWS